MISEELIKKSKTAIGSLDGTEAAKLVKEVERALRLENSRGLSPGDLNALKNLSIKLQLVAFPNLPDEKSEEVLRKHFLKSFDAGVSMENQLTAKLFSVPYIPRDELRKGLQKAILENNEQFGPLTVGQWLQEFEKMFNVHTRDRSAPVRFVMEHPQARALSEIDKAKLKEIIYTYDYLLVSTLPATGPVLEEILHYSLAERRETRETAEARPVIAPVRTGGERGSRTFYEPLIQRRTAGLPSGPSEEITGIERLPLSPALQKYPHLGEQLVTGSPIKLKIFPEPVRPSIKNWIADYHSVLGAGAHGTMERGNFLYHSENAKRLSFGERQKLAVILKSLDENEPISVDADKQEIIFNLQQTTYTSQPATNNLPQKENGQWPVESGQSRDSAVKFSYPQKLASERPQQKNYQHYDPYQIIPTGYPEDKPKPEPPPPPPELRRASKPPEPPKSEPRTEGNIVDLRGQQ